MLNALSTAEIQVLRLNLQLFASRQTDQTVRSQCLAVDTRLGEALGGDDPILRQVLANSVEQLEEAIRPSNTLTIEEATARFLDPTILPLPQLNVLSESDMPLPIKP
jgi:hypothetical protein